MTKKERDRAYYLKNKEKIKARNKKYYEDNREKCIQDRRAYYRNNKESLLIKNKEYRNSHKEEYILSKAKYYQENKESCKARAKKWADENKDKRSNIRRKYRDLKKVNDFMFTEEDKKIVEERFHHKCFLCHTKENLVIDHFRPLSKGNGLSLRNAVLLCSSCNNKKHSKDPHTFFSTNQILQLQSVGVY